PPVPPTTDERAGAAQRGSRIAVIDHGKVIAEGTPGQLKSSIGAGTVHVRLRDAGQRPDAGRLLSEVLRTGVTMDADPVALTARADGAGSEQGAAEEASRAL